MQSDIHTMINFEGDENTKQGRKAIWKVLERFRNMIKYHSHWKSSNKTRKKCNPEIFMERKSTGVQREKSGRSRHNLRCDWQQT